MGNSTAKWDSIKNRMTKSKSGFMCIESNFPPPGFEKTYTHVLWDGQPNAVPINNTQNSSYEYLPVNSSIPEAPKSPNYDYPSSPDSTEQLTFSPVFTPLNNIPHKEENILDNIFNSEIIPVTLLKRQPLDVWSSYQFSISHFINELRSLPNLYMSDFDKMNFEILLSAETGAQTDLMPLTALTEFGIRFGSWMKIVEKVRDFVTDGASNWFCGKLDATQATKILSGYSNEREFYLIRSVPVDSKSVPDLKYVFAISYRKIAGPIAHLRIYKNKLDRYCMIDEGSQTREFANFQQIIHTVLKKDPVPISNPHFAGLMQTPNGKIFTNDIQGKKDYERLAVDASKN